MQSISLLGTLSVVNRLTYVRVAAMSAFKKIYYVIIMNSKLVCWVILKREKSFKFLIFLNTCRKAAYII